MADNSKIEWTDATWTPIKGCTRVSPGCGGPGKAGGCYAEIMAARFSKPGQWGEGLAEIVTLPDGSKDHRWTGVVRFDEKELLKPLSWRTPRLIFVCSTADLFHEKVEDEWIDRIFAVMALCPQHTFQVLTKRPERMQSYLTARKSARPISVAVGDGTLTDHPFNNELLPPPNIWLGTSTEDQQRADERIPHLLATPAAVRFISAEPLLGPINIHNAMWAGDGDPLESLTSTIDWVIAGGESGPSARPMHPDCARSLRDQCSAAGVPFFFKQWGAYAPLDKARPVVEGPMRAAWPDGTVGYGSAKANGGPGTALFLGSKNVTGRLLDGRTHDELPVVTA